MLLAKGMRRENRGSPCRAHSQRARRERMFLNIPRYFSSAKKKIFHIGVCEVLRKTGSIFAAPQILPEKMALPHPSTARWTGTTKSFTVLQENQRRAQTSRHISTTQPGGAGWGKEYIYGSY